MKAWIFCSKRIKVGNQVLCISFRFVELPLHDSWSFGISEKEFLFQINGSNKWPQYK
jgi:hypothetical protein